MAQRLANRQVAAAFPDENAFVENRWCQLRDTVQSTALAVLGRTWRQHQDWLNDNEVPISNLLLENRLHEAYINHPTGHIKSAFYRSRRLLKQRLQEMQDSRMAHKPEVVEGYADRSEWENFFSAIEAVYGPPTKATAPLLSADGNTLLTGKTQILQRWAKHLRGVLYHLSTISDAAVACLPQIETKADLDLRPFSTKPSGSCISSPAGKRPERARYLMNSTNTVPTTCGSSDNALSGEVASRRNPLGFQGRHRRPSLQAEKEPSTL
nr:unnamed protein product [Spirometra erinaceieuropaei]